MSLFSLLWSGMRQYVRLHVAAGLGVAAATAVLTGALLVGDSVRGSLRDLALEGLGRIDFALVAPHFFRQELAAELTGSESLRPAHCEIVPAILLTGNLKSQQNDNLATQVQVLGSDERFWTLGASVGIEPPAVGEVILNEPLARELAAQVGHRVVLRLPQASRIPADSTLGRKYDMLLRVDLTVSAILPGTGLGRFSLYPQQQATRNAYVHVQSLQGRNRPAATGEVNALFVAAKDPSTTLPDDLVAGLNSALRPRLADYGLSVDTIEYRVGERTVVRGFQLASQRMLLAPEVERAALAAWKDYGAVPVYTYLANTIAAGEREIPYSTITAIDANQELGPYWQDATGKEIGALADDEIVLNDWAAEDIQAQAGMSITIKYFEPETTHGEARERSATFRLKGIVALTTPTEPSRRGSVIRFDAEPTPATDASWTPEVEGITDKDMRDWDAPFPYDATRIRPRDDEYWEEFHTTPKAFLSLAAGQKLWGSRFGKVTSIRVPFRAGLTADALAARLKLDPAKLGMEFRPVRQLALQAAGGTTQFEQLFLGFSFFIIASAAILTALLVRLGLEQRAAELGVLVSMGWRMSRVRRLLSAESAVVAVVGGALGVALGIGYCRLMLAALTSPHWWLQAIGTPFLQLHLDRPLSLVIGGTSGVLISMAVITLALRQLRRTSPRQLLAGQLSAVQLFSPRERRWTRALVPVPLFVAVALVFFARNLSGEAQAGAFFGGGSLVLAALLTAVWRRLRRDARGLDGPSRWPLAMLALRNEGRRPGRNTLTIGLVASACFLIVAMSAFRLNPAEDLEQRTSGSGGFVLLAESDQSIFPDLNTVEGRAELGVHITPPPEIYSLRVQPGEDASCLNLYQAVQPRVLGIPERLIERGGFAWGVTAAANEEEAANPWVLLDRDLGRTPEGRTIVPVVIDQATAVYSLHLSGVGASYSIVDGHGESLTLQVVGLLKNSVLQGALMVSERNFTRRFPAAAGYRMFLIGIPGNESASTGATADKSARDVAAQLEGALGDYGFDAQETSERLAQLMSVQNTYLSTFQSLGGLGLLLGTFGLAAVQLRNILERRGELALMRAAGYRQGRLAALVMLENAFLLIGGLSIGVLSAAVVVVPHWLSGGAAAPWLGLAIMLVGVALVGAAVSVAAVRAMLKSPILPALRGE